MEINHEKAIARVLIIDESVMNICCQGPVPGFNNLPGGNTTRYAVFSIIDPDAHSTLTPCIGRVHKHAANPLFTGTNIWEHDINNG